MFYQWPHEDGQGSKWPKLRADLSITLARVLCAMANERQPITHELPLSFDSVAVPPGNMGEVGQLQVSWAAAAVDLPRLPCETEAVKSPNKRELQPIELR